MDLADFVVAWGTSSNAGGGIQTGSGGQTGTGDAEFTNTSSFGYTYSANGWGISQYEGGGTSDGELSDGDTSGEGGFTAESFTAEDSIGWGQTITNSAAYNTSSTTIVPDGDDTISAVTTFSTSSSTEVITGSTTTVAPSYWGFTYIATTAESSSTYAQQVETTSTGTFSFPTSTNISSSDTVGATTTDGDTTTTTEYTSTYTTDTTTSSNSSWTYETVTSTEATSTFRVGSSSSASGNATLVNPTAWILGANQVAWVLTLNETIDDLSMLQDMAESATDSFSLPDEPVTGEVEALVMDSDATTLTLFPDEVTLSNVTETITFTSSSSDFVPTTVIMAEAISNSTSTQLTTIAVTDTYENVVAVGGIGGQTSNPFTALATSSITVWTFIPSSSVGYCGDYDASGMQTGWTTSMTPIIVATTMSMMISALVAFSGEGTNTDEDYIYEGEAGETDTTVGAPELWGFSSVVTAGPPNAIVPMLPMGVCLPDSDISSRLPNRLIGAADLEFPCPFILGQQPSIYTPSIAQSLTTTDTDSVSYTLSMSWGTDGVTMSATWDDGTDTGTGSGSLTTQDPVEGETTGLGLWEASNGFGGFQPNLNENMSRLFNYGILDSTLVDNSTHAGTLATVDNFSDEPEGSDGAMAFATIPAWMPWPGLGNPAITMAMNS